MPAAWSAKDERQYKHILKSCAKRGKYGRKRCKSIAAATVNAQRSDEGRTLGGWAEEGYVETREGWVPHSKKAKAEARIQRLYNLVSDGRMSQEKADREAARIRGGRTLGGVGSRAASTWDSAYQKCWKRSSEYKKGHTAGSMTVNRCSAEAKAALGRKGLNVRDIGEVEIRHPELAALPQDLPDWVLPAALGALAIVLIKV